MIKLHRLILHKGIIKIIIIVEQMINVHLCVNASGNPNETDL